MGNKSEDYHPDAKVVLTIDNGKTITDEQLVERCKNHPMGPGYTVITSTRIKK